MTRRDVVIGVLALLIGVLVAWFLVRRAVRPRASPVVVDLGRSSGEDASTPTTSLDAAVPTEDAPIELADSSLLDPVLSSPPVRAHDAGHARDARDAKAPHDAAPEAAPIVLRETNLVIRPVGNETVCVDAPTHGHTLQLYPCHGRTNQRWNFAEDTGGASRITAVDGDCVHIGQSSRGDGLPVEVGPCGADAARFRHMEGRRLQEVRTGHCITVSRLETHAHLALAPCDPSNIGQQWSLAP